jgi:hypothetical protein
MEGAIQGVRWVIFRPDTEKYGLTAEDAKVKAERIQRR